MQPSVLVLLATYNGELWISEQLDSIYKQKNCDVTVLVSDDCSTDRTADIINSYANSLSIELLEANARKFGNANRNFLWLILQSKYKNYDYIAFSDQDDIWLEDKLDRAIKILKDNDADCYSSDVCAFWDHGRQKVLVKSQKQRGYDYLFESAGPGCTFVITREKFTILHGLVSTNVKTFQSFVVHDWLIYAIARSSNWKWIIDSFVSVNYRQHERNQIGANVGHSAALARIRHVIDGQYFNSVLTLIGILDSIFPPNPCHNRIMLALKRFEFIDLVYLLGNVTKLRRKSTEAFVLGLLLLTFYLFTLFNRGCKKQNFARVYDEKDSN